MKINKPSIKFIKANHKIPLKYWELNYKRFTSTAKTPYEKLRAIFIDSLSASGGPVKLDDKYKAVNDFLKSLAPLKSKSKIDFNNFCKCIIGQKIIVGTDCRKALIIELWKAMKTFPQIGPKKAAMFIKNVMIFGENDIFTRFEQNDKKYLIVPVDRIVRSLSEKIFGMKLSNNAEDDEIIQKKSEELFSGNPILLDDLWFWGHFSMKRGRIHKRCNRAILETDLTITEDFITQYNLVYKLNKFIKILG